MLGKRLHHSVLLPNGHDSFIQKQDPPLKDSTEETDLLVYYRSTTQRLCSQLGHHCDFLLFVEGNVSKQAFHSQISRPCEQTLLYIAYNLKMTI